MSWQLFAGDWLLNSHKKWDQPYNVIMVWLRCRLSFLLPRSSIQTIRSACLSAGQFKEEVHPQSGQRVKNGYCSVISIFLAL